MDATAQELLVTLARSLNRKVDPGSTLDRGSRPGDAYAARTSWADILQPAGWEKVRQDATLSYWRRPGKTGQVWSATTGPRGEAGDLLYVFSSSCAPFDVNKSYTKFAAYALLNHGGDYAAAARELVRLGYGTGRRSETNGTPHANGVGGAPHAEPRRPEPPPPEPFPPFKAASALQQSEGGNWLWHGFLSRGDMTLLSALWKAGKTTLLTHLLLALERGGEFCGRTIEAGRVLYVTEESETRWAVRRDQCGIHDHVEFLVRPFKGRPDWARWREFGVYLDAEARRRQADLIVIDTLSRMWPVRDENDASQVTEAMMPLQGVGGECCVLPVHHARKSDGQEGTAARGSGALSAFVDTIVELRRHSPGDRRDRRRVLTSYGRWDETPEELVIELGESGGYTASGDRHDTSLMTALPVILGILRDADGALGQQEVYDAWPDDGPPKPPVSLVREALNRGASMGQWSRQGQGRRGSPFLYGMTAGCGAGDSNC